MVSKYEHRYKDEDPRRRARLVLGSILAAVAVPLMAVAVSAMTPKPGSGGDLVANIAQRVHQLAVERNDQRQQFAGPVRLADLGQR
jgi:hypothetical protein